MTQKTIKGIVYDVYTMDDWKNDRELKVKEGQLIDPSIFFLLLNCIPPRRWDSLFQVGEAYSHDWNTGKPLYQTFEPVGDNDYKYIGLKE